MIERSAVRRSTRVPVLVIILLFATSPRLGADSVKCPPPPDGILAIPADSFYVYRSGLKGQHLRWRDVEFMVDTLYTRGLSENTITAVLDKFAGGLVDSAGQNGLRVDASPFRLLYDYFRTQGAFYTSDPQDTASVVLGNASYNPSDRSHADVYIVYPTRLQYGGQYPALTWQEDDEDRSSGHDKDPQHQNSLEIKGIDPAQESFSDFTGNGWTSPRGARTFLFSHEFQHMIPNPNGGWRTELFSAGAEALAVNPDTTSNVEFPYTVSLLGYGRYAPDPSEPERLLENNYQGRSAFMTYLTYNFTGTDTSSSLGATNDDLVRRWARSPARSLQDLKRLLRDSCETCVSKHYFPAEDRLRLGALLHNWRVATYVNNPSLDEGQWGFGTRASFSPGRQLGAWTPHDPFPSNDLIAVPPEVTLSGQHLTRDLVLDGTRSFNGTSYPLVLQPLGSEYWIVRADPSIWQSGQDLHVRVSASIGKFSNEVLCGFPGGRDYDGRLWASMVAYREATNPSEPLWKHPEWVARVLATRSVDVDSLRGPLDFFVPSFGDSYKAVLIVLTASDGPWEGYLLQEPHEYHELVRYQLQIGVRRAPVAIEGATPALATAGRFESDPAWAPRGDTLAYSGPLLPGGKNQIWLRSLNGTFHQRLRPSSRGQRDPDWSPRGDWLAYREECANPLDCDELKLFNRETGEARTALSAAIGPTRLASKFSPNGQELAYVSWVAAGQPSSGSILGRINLAGTQDSLLVRRSDGVPFASPRWSPDGAWIYFVANDSLYAVGAGGVDRGKVLKRDGIFRQLAAFDLPMSGPRIAAEEMGDAVWYTYCSYQGDDEGRDTSIAHPTPFRRVTLRDTANADTIVATYRNGGSYYGPRLSPDGTRVAWSTNQDSPSDRDVYVEPVSWNHPPSFVTPPADLAIETGPGASIAVDLDATDPDGETPIFGALYVPSGASFNTSTGQFSWPHPPGNDSAFVLFRALDGSGGVAHRVARYRIAPAVAPAVVTLEQEVLTSSSITVSWTSPGDDGTAGTATQYDLRWYTAPITEANWYAATPVDGEPAPLEAGHTQSATISGLEACTWYYLAMKTRDEAHNWSAVSDTFSIRTLCGPGEEEGDVAERRDEPSGLSASPATADPLGGVPVGSTSALALERRSESGVPGWSGYLLPAAEAAALFPEGADAVLIQTPGDSLPWETAARIGHRFAGQVALCSPGSTPRRYLFPSRYALDRFSGAVNHERLGVPLRAAALTSSRSGSLPINSDLGAASLAANDTLRISYVADEAAAARSRPWFVLLGAAEAGGALTSQPATRPEAPPVSFALQQSQPNPFRREVTIRFDLPRESAVRLTVHDLQGRLIATLGAGTFPAGRHAVSWNRRSPNGDEVPPGVYLYRIEAGPWRAQKKMVALP